MKTVTEIKDIPPISTNTEPNETQLHFTATGNSQEIEWLKKKVEAMLANPLDAVVMPKATVWVTYDKHGDLETEFIYPETEEHKMPYQCEKYLMDNKLKTATRLSCFSA